MGSTQVVNLGLSEAINCRDKCLAIHAVPEVGDLHLYINLFPQDFLRMPFKWNLEFIIHETAVDITRSP